MIRDSDSENSDCGEEASDIGSSKEQADKHYDQAGTLVAEQKENKS